MHARIRYLVLLLVVMSFVAGCSSATPVATPTPTRTPIPQATAIPPTPIPTATPTPTPTTVPTAEAVSVTPFPPDVDPLTGLKVDDPEILEHIPLVIKISNSPEVVRPQSGLNSADLIFEHYAEGYAVTRFTGVFYGAYPERVGSVRSGRLIDLEIPAMYQGILAFSGMSGGMKQCLRASDLFPDQVASPDFGVGQPYFYRVPRDGLSFEHTLFTDPQELRALAAERGIDQRPDFPSLMAFSESLPSIKESAPASTLKIDYLANVCRAQWDYDEELGRWKRSTAGQIHKDYLTGEQVTAANVVVVFANHIEAGFWEEMIGDTSNWKLSVEIQIWGNGPALVFRDGQMLQGYWRRESREDMLTFWDGEGNPLPLKPGNSWYQLVPLDTPSEEYEPGKFRFTP